MTQGPPLVSAIVVTYRSREVIDDLLDDLAGAVDEVVVVDNASDDGTREALRARNGIRCVFRNRNDGFAAGVNDGVAAATGRYLFLVNPDARVPQGAVERLLAASRRHPGETVGPLVRSPGGRLQPSRSGVPSLWNLLGEQFLVPESARPGRWPARLWPRWRSYDREAVAPVLSGCALLVPRELWQLVGPFDERFFLFWEEVDWQVRAQRAGRRSWIVPDAEVEHGRGTSSDVGALRRSELYCEAARAYLDKWFRPPSRAVALLILWAGQAVRHALWSLTPLRSRPGARTRRAVHRTAMRTLLGADRSGPRRA